MGSIPVRRTKHSELPEWPIGASWKDDGPARGTRVQISHSLPHGRLSELGSGLFRKQNDSQGLGFDSSVFHQIWGLHHTRDNTCSITGTNRILEADTNVDNKYSTCSYSLMVEHLLGMEVMVVRFYLGAPLTFVV